MKKTMEIQGRLVGDAHAPLVIPEVGINHEGCMAKARQMVDDAAAAGAECVKFQCHVVDDEMAPQAQEVIPGNADESIWAIMERCAFDEAQERDLRDYVEGKGLIYISTPFSRAAADRLESMGVSAYKIGSGECNNYPLIDHIASFGKPIILSTGMNGMKSVAKAVDVLESRRVPYALLHCTSMYPTPYDKVRLGALEQMAEEFPNAVLGLSDHSLGTWTCFGAIPYGARILEKHFTSDTSWPGPDVPISITPNELQDLIIGSRAIHQALGGDKSVLAAEQPTIDFAYACVVTIAEIEPGEPFTKDNLWVKRPGTGEILAEHFDNILGKSSAGRIAANQQLRWEQING